MSAIITENFRKNNAKRLLEDMADVANKYYIGLGKSDAWEDQGSLTEEDAEFDVVPALGTIGDQTEILNNLTTLIGINGSVYSQVIPNISAKTNHRHKAYNPFDPDCFYQTTVNTIEMYPCYVVVNDNVYLCLRSPTSLTGPFTLPSGASTSRIPVVNVDGSVWIYVYTVENSFPIRGSQFITVPTEPTLVNAETELTVLDDIETASGHLVYGFTVINGGTGYVSAPTAEFIPFDAPSSPITLVATLTGGSVSSVVFNAGIVDNPGSWIKKPGYVRLTGGGSTVPAIVYPNIAPAVGIGSDPSQTLPSWYVGIAVSAEEEIFGDGAFIPYRQISIVRNPENDGVAADPELSLNCLQYIQFNALNAPSSGIDVGAIITQAATGARAIGDYYVSATRRLYFHQTYETGFTEFNDSDEVTIDSTGYTPEAIGNSEYNKETGEVIFVENRKKISRTSGQTEELTIILQF
jgi:hypothetical protein